jgi:hypothetical protein
MKRYRAILALIAALSLLAGTVETTSAHSISTWTETYASDTNCTKGYAEISHGTQDSGYSRVEVESRYRLETPFGGYDCYTQWDRSAWQIRAKYTLLKKIDGTEDWAWCVNSEWYYNQSTMWAFAIEAWHGENYTPPCGHGDYATSGGAFVENGGTWYGGYAWAGQHWLP